MASRPETLLKIGQIVGPHGLKGLIKIDPMTDLEEHFDVGARVRVGEDWYEIASSSWHKGRPLISLTGIASMDAAEAIRWKYLEAAPLAHPDMEGDEYRVEDLIGCKVVTEDGEELGELDEVILMPAHDIYRVGDILIPAVQEFILEIDLHEERITVRLIPGMRGEETD